MPAIDSWNVSVNSYPANMAVTNSVSGGALIFLVLIVFGAIALILLITSLERYTTFFKTFEKLIRSIRYTLFGAGILVALYAIYIVCTILAEFGSGINPIHIGLGVATYIGITLLGYGATLVVRKFAAMHEQYKGQEKKQEEVSPP
jgi:hypothetical protein